MLLVGVAASVTIGVVDVQELIAQAVAKPTNWQRPSSKKSLSSLALGSIE